MDVVLKNYIDFCQYTINVVSEENLYVIIKHFTDSLHAYEIPNVYKAPQLIVTINKAMYSIWTWCIIRMYNHNKKAQSICRKSVYVTSYWDSMPQWFIQLIIRLLFKLRSKIYCSDIVDQSGTDALFFLDFLKFVLFCFCFCFVLFCFVLFGSVYVYVLFCCVLFWEGLLVCLFVCLFVCSFVRFCSWNAWVSLLNCIDEI